ncbi:hypothetical protein PI125_g13872 [Phytophthora idaei]|nr:hypothetical protein PI125_g13872 [Phytophthora idaei]KAG3137509.1 hypothetical protein PI126_g17370 [Phytophthora idaei]
MKGISEELRWFLGATVLTATATVPTAPHAAVLDVSSSTEAVSTRCEATSE